MSAQWWKRIFLGNAMDVDMDATGRVLVSPELREAVGLTKEVVLLGMGNHFELWDKATYEAHEAKAMRSEEHTSELQSQSNLVCRLLLEKKKKKLDRGHRGNSNADQ